jgi:osmotically-inducible protein OsmY
VRRGLAIAWVTLTIGAGTLDVGCARTRQPPRVGIISLDDATLTVRVKTALLNHPSLGGLKIDVTTIRGVVTLSGTVPTREDESSAVALVKSVEGVREVTSTLQVQP